MDSMGKKCGEQKKRSYCKHVGPTGAPAGKESAKALSFPSADSITFFCV